MEFLFHYKTFLSFLFFYFLFVSFAFAGLEATTTPSTTPASNDGTIDLTITGGYAPYDIIWQGPNGFTSTEEDLTGLAPGVYEVEVTDALCGIANLSVTVESCPTSMIMGIQPVYPCEDQENGKLKVSLDGSGSLPLIWECRQMFSGTLVASGQITQLDPFSINLLEVNGLESAIYTFSISDSRDCEDSYNVILLASDIEIEGTIGASCSPNEGSIQLSVNTNYVNPPLQYEWDDGATTKDREGLAAGQYCVIVSDATGCSSTECFTVDNNTLEAYIASVKNNLLCDDEIQQGQIDIEVPHATGTVSYSWIGPGNYTAHTQDISGLTNGEYTLTITDGDGCRRVLSVFICCCGSFRPPEEGEPPHAQQCFGAAYDPFNIELVELIQIGMGNDKGAIDIEGKGGVDGPRYYTWEGPDGYVAYTQDISELDVGEYCVTATDGCKETSKCFEIVNCDLNSMTITGNVTETCNGVEAGSIILTINGGEMPYTASWNNGQTGTSIVNLAEGEYCATVADANGCTAETVCFTVGSHPGEVSNSSFPCTRTVHCNGEDYEEHFGYVEWWECNTFYRRCPLTGATVSLDFGWADVEVVGCNLFGICWDGNAVLLEQGWPEYGPFTTRNESCPQYTACVDYACYIPDHGYWPYEGSSEYCSTITYSSDPNCSATGCRGYVYCGTSYIGSFCANNITTCGPSANNQENDLSLLQNIFDELGAIKLLNKPLQSTVYPNPFTNEITLEVQLEQTTNITLVVTNLLGEKMIVVNNIMGKGLSKEVIHLSGLQSGLYFLQVYKGKELLGIHKIIKN